MEISEDSNTSIPVDLAQEIPLNSVNDSLQADLKEDEVPEANEPEAEHQFDAEEQDEEDLNEKKNKTTGGFTGRGVTLQMLLDDNILKAKEGAMSLEYMGQKFEGDLLSDGRIRSSEVQEVFSSPSAWALRCKKIVNPEQKYGCGWSSVSSPKDSIVDVRYCGRPLDVYKNQWMRKRRLEQTNDYSIPDSGASIPDPEPPAVVEPAFKIGNNERAVVKHEMLGNRSTIDDINLLVETLCFTTFGKLQPFPVSLHTSAVVVIDVHCSITSSEVVGYLAGLWDINSNVLSIKRAYPCLSRLSDHKHSIELEIFQSIEAAGLTLIGWYHSHPSAPPTPTVQDIDAQMEYQLKLKGTGEQGYRPCVGIISAPYHRPEPSEPSSALPLSCFWVSPPPESRPQELARPMAMQYNIAFDSSIEDDVTKEIVKCLNFYKHAPDLIKFDEIWMENVTILDKLKASLVSNLQLEDEASLLKLIDDHLSSTNGMETKSETPDIMKNVSDRTEISAV